MVSVEFYVYGILFYVPTAALISYILAAVYEYYEENKKPEVKDEKKLKQKKQESQGKQKPAQPSVIPKGKVGYCKYCEIYLANDNHYYNHVEGKKHKVNVEGHHGNWIEFINESIYKENSSTKKFQKTSDKDFEEGWVL